MPDFVTYRYSIILVNGFRGKIIVVSIPQSFDFLDRLCLSVRIEAESNAETKVASELNLG